MPLVLPLTMPACLQRAAAQQKGIVFISGGEKEERLSYRELYTAALYCLGALQQQGVQRGDELVMQVEDNRTFLVVFWACLLGGIIPVPLSIGIQDEHKRKLFLVWELLHRPWLVADEEQIRQITRYAGKTGRSGWQSQLDGHTIHPAAALAHTTAGETADIHTGDLAYLQFSSGSTGDPKGVMLTHENLYFNTLDIAARCGVTASDRSLSWMPLTHDMGLICFHLTAVAKCADQLIIPTSVFIRRPLLWLDKATQHRATQLYSPNFGYEYLLAALEGRSMEWDLSAVRIIYNGAEPVSYKTCTRFLDAMQQYGLAQNAMHPGYGLAEASVAVSLPDPGTPLAACYLDRTQLRIGDTVRRLQPGNDSAAQFIEVGYPIGHCYVRICNDNDEVLEDDTIGHIQVSGKNVTAGYYNLPELTQKIITTDGWLRTGDLGFTVNGKLVITGRHKNLVIINGQNYYPQDIERMLEDMPGLETGKVVAASSSGNGMPETFLLFVLFKGNAGLFAPLAKKITIRLTERLGFAPDRIIAVNKIPKTTSGKIQQYQLVTRYRDGEFDAFIRELEKIQQESDTVLSGLDAEEKISALFEAVTGRLPDMAQGPVANGMNSLQATMFLNRWQKLTGSLLTTSGLFELSSFSLLAERLRTGSIQPAAALPSIAVSSAPLSHAQQRIWVLCQMQDMSASFHLSTAIRIKGRLNIVALEKALHDMVQRHPALRTVIKQTTGGTIQGFNEQPGWKLTQSHQPLTSLDIRELVMQEAGRDFDAGTSLFRAVLVSAAEDDHLLQCTFHHIIFDGWSYGLFTQELDTLYSHYAGNKEVVLPPVHRYSDFVTWEDNWLKQADAATDLAYWKKELQGVLPRLGQLRQFNHNTPGRHPGSTMQFSFPAELWNAVNTLCIQLSVSPFNLLLAALNLQYYILTGQKDIILGTESAGRTRSEWEPVIGYFLNTLPVRMQLEDTLAFPVFLQQVKEKLHAAYAHQQYPVDLVIDEMGLGAQPGSSRLFDVLVLYQNFNHALEMHTLGGLEVTPVDIPEQTSITDLQLEFRETNGQLRLHIRFDTRYYDELFVTQFFSRFEQLLQHITAAPGTTLGELAVISDAEKDSILHRFNQPLSPYPFQPVTTAIEQQALRHANKTAVVCAGNRLTYGQLVTEMNERAAWLAEQGIGKGSRVAIMMQRSEQMIVALLAVLKTGAAYIPIEPAFHDERIQFMLENSEAGWLLTDKTKIVSGNTQLLQWELLQQSHNPAVVHPTINEHDLAYILYTSGTTGNPKGVLIEQGSVYDYVQTFSRYFSITENDVVVQQSNLSFDTHVEEIFPALQQGATLVVMPEGGRNIEQLSVVLQAEQVTVLSTTPLVINELNRVPQCLSSLRILISGGDELKMAYISRIPASVQVFNTYGPTESTVCASFQPVLKKEDCRFIGKPIPNRQLFIINQSGQLLPAGIAGEIVIAGAGLARGYQRLEEETAFRFIEIEGRRVYRTGDMGRWTADGRIEFLGRTDDQVKIRGYRVELNEVEEALLRYPAIKNAAVKVWGANDNKYLAAYYVTGGAEVPEETLAQFLLDILPEYMVPARFLCMNALPVSANGKTDKKQLPEPAAGETILEISGEAETAMAGLWRELLPVENIHAGSGFFQCGGSSIRAAQIAGRLHQQGWNMLRMSDFFVHTTLRSLSRQLHREQQAQPIRQERSLYPLTHEQRRLWYLQQLERTTAFNLGWSYRISGNLDIAAFTKALHTIVERHDNLRTVFVEKEGVPYMNILTAGEMPVWFRLTTGDEPQDDAGRVFDLTNGPLLMATLVQQPGNEYLFRFVIHHIVTDGWSMQVFIKELKELYTAAVENRDAVLKDISLRFHDYAILKTEMPAQEAERHKKFWKEELGTPVPAFTLPARALALPGSAEENNRLRFVFSEQFTRELHQTVQREQTSLFSGLLSVISALCYQYTGNTEILVGTDAADRQHPGLEQAMGYFLNELVIRLHCSGEETFNGLLQHTRQKITRVFEHAQYPYDLETGISRAAAGKPLFNLLVLLQNFDAEDVLETLHPALSVQRLAAPVQDTITDLQLEFFPKGNTQLVAEARFNTSVYDRRQVEQLLRHLEILGLRLMAGPGEQLAAHQILTPAQIGAWLNERNDTATGYGPFVPVCRLIEEQVQKNPAKTAIVCGQQKLSYGEWNAQANGLAQLLLQQKTTSGRIGLLAPRSEQCFTGLLGIMKAGKTYVPLDTELPQERLKFMAEDSGLDVVVTDETHALAHKEWLAAYTVIIMPAGQASLQNPQVAINENDTAYIIYTSGSTGKPKGVMISQAALADYVHTFTRYFSVGENDRVIQQSSVSFDTMVEEVFPVLLAGGTLYVLPSGGKDVEALLQTIYNEQITILSTTPAVIAEINRLGLNTSALRVLISGGDVLKAVQVNRLLGRVAIYNTYGPSESTVCATYHRVSSEQDVSVIGRPIANRRVYLFNKDQQLVADGTLGEICLGGKGLAQGYVNREDENRARFFENPYRAGERLYRTGDLAYIDGEGNLRFTGRADSQFKLSGYRIEPGEIEQVCLGIQDIREALAMVRTHHDHSVLVLYYTTQSGIPHQHLHDELLRRLPAYMVPAHCIHLNAFPLNTNGKTDRQALPFTETGTPAANRPLTPMENLLAQTWQQVLEVGVSSPFENFFSAGGNSLTGTRLVNAIAQATGRRITLKDLFAHPALCSLATVVEQAPFAGPMQVNRVEAQEYYAASFAQKRMWVLHQLDEQHTAYNISFTSRLAVAADSQLLEKAFHLLVERHESLRTIFREQGGVPVQVILPAAQCSADIACIRLNNKTRAPGELQNIITRESSRAFALDTWPLCRLVLVLDEHDDSWFLCTLHHIIADGVSVTVMMNELLQLYTALVNNQPLTLPELPFQYKDYVLAQERRLASGIWNNQEAYWLSVFEPGIPVLEIPGCLNRPPTRSYRGKTISFTMPAAQVTIIRQLMRQHDATLFMTLLCTVFAMLHRYTRQDDLVIGTPVAGRNEPGTESLVGLLVNTLPLRVQVPAQRSFGELLETVKQTAMEAYACQDYPFDLLIEKLNPERNLGRSPLFDVMVVVLDGVLGTTKNNSGATGYRYNSNTSSKFDLNFDFEEQAEGIEVRVQFNEDIFTAELMERFVHYYQCFTAQCTAHPTQPLHTLSYMPAEELSAVFGFNPTATNIPAQNIIHLLEEQVAQQAGREALCFDGKVLDYLSFNREVNRLAHYLLKEHDLKPGELTGVMLPRSEQLVIAIWAIIKAGGVYVPVDPAYPAARREYLVTDSGIRLLLTDIDEATAQLPCTVCNINTIPLEQYSEENPGIYPQHSNGVYAIYTSGTTGQPKGVLTEHGSLLNLVTWLGDIIYNRPQPLTCLLTASVNFDASVQQLFAPFVFGHTLVVISEQTRRDIQLYAAALVKEQVQVIDLTPSFLNVLLSELEAANQKPPVLYTLVGGEPLESALVERYGQLFGAQSRLINVYGVTEATVDSTFELAVAGKGSATIGRPLPNTQVFILDEHLQPVPVGIPGQICLAGAGLGRSYLNRPELTAAKFIHHQLNGQEIRLYLTGDTGKWRADGTIEFIGRTDRQVKLRGYRIELGEIESMLLQHPEIKQAYVLLHNQTLTGYYTAAVETDPASPEKFLQERLPAYMIPSAWMQLEQFPVTHSGKINEALLPLPSKTLKEYVEAEHTDNSPLFGQVAEIWKETLHLQHCTPADNFFASGGHSLIAMMLASRLSKRTGVHIRLQDIFLHQTLNGLVEWIKEKGTAYQAAAVYEMQQHYPLSPAQEQIWIAVQQGGGNAYHMPSLYALEGALNIAALEQAGAALVARHETLRTGFTMIGGEPRQFIRQPKPFVIPVTDTDEQHAHNLIEEFIAAPFALHTDELLRMKLLRLGTERFLLVFVLHHIISDGLSAPVIMNDLVQLYTAFCNNTANPLLPLNRQYKDYLLQQQDWLSGAGAATSAHYWKKQLQDVLPAVTLPADNPQTLANEWTGEKITMMLDSSLANDISRFAVQRHITLNAYLLTCAFLALHSFTGSTRLVIGVPVAGRNNEAMEEQVGLYVNTLPLTCGATETGTGAAWLQAVQHNMQDAVIHQHYPVHLLEDEAVNNGPLFNILFVYNEEDALSGNLQAAGLNIQTLPVKEASTKYDITISFTKGPSALNGHIKYRASKYSAARVALFRDRLLHCCAALLHAPEHTAGALFAVPAGTEDQDMEISIDI